MIFSQYTIEDQRILMARGDGAAHMIAADGDDFDYMRNAVERAEWEIACAPSMARDLFLDRLYGKWAASDFMGTFPEYAHRWDSLVMHADRADANIMRALTASAAAADSPYATNCERNAIEAGIADCYGVPYDQPIYNLKDRP